MKAAILCILFTATTWALPKVQNPTPFKRYVDPINAKFALDVTPRIINGEEVIPHSIPYQVYLIIISNTVSVWTCGGSLITPKYVLTSANCLYDAAEAIVHLGFHNIQEIEDTQVVVQSRSFISYEGYKPENIYNDIGVIELNEPVELNEYIDVVALPPRNTTTDFAGENGRISGWGMVASDGDISHVLLQANVSVMSSAECNDVYGIIRDTQICSIGEEGQTVCDGDNGGPLIVDNTQIGIVSFTAGGCPSNRPAGYTRITSYFDWLEENTGLKF